jgi:NifU-like protein
VWEYSDKVKDHFLNPRNVGDIKNPDGIGEVGSAECGDALRLTFTLGRDQRIKDAKFKAFGCCSAIASASALTEMIKGLTLEEAEKITKQDIVDYLDGLPEEKVHCSVMGCEALQAAITNYQQRDGSPVVCQCYGMTRKGIEDVCRRNHIFSLEEIMEYTKAGSRCGSCHDQIKVILDCIKDDHSTKIHNAKGSKIRD